jgi:O-antigen/teichoic acid export membrane protein
VADDPARLRRAYVLCQQTLAAAVLPVGLLLGFSAPRVLPIVFGPDWAVASQLLVWLGPIVALQTLSLPVYSLALVLDRTKWLAGRDLSYIVIRLGPTIAAAALWGLKGAVVARTVIGVLQFLINLRIASSLIDLTVLAQLRMLLRTLWSLAAMGCALAMLGAIDVSASNEIAGIGWTALIGAVSVAVYGAVHWSLWAQADSPDGPEAKVRSLLRNLRPTGRSVVAATALPATSKPDHHVVLKEMQP